MTATLRGSTVTPTPSTPTNTNVVSGVLNAPPPRSNMYPQSTAVVEANVKQQAATLGHNAFRPDIYRVTNGLVT